MSDSTNTALPSLRPGIKLLGMSLVFLAVHFGNAIAIAQDSPSETDETDELIRRFCVHCHQGDDPEAELRIDDSQLQTPSAINIDMARKILDAIESSRMPPKDEPHPSPKQRRRMVAWATTTLENLEANARNQGITTRNRRLTVDEYEYTMRSLFGVDARFADLLPEDPLSEVGYRNSNERLGLSSLQLEAYLDSARRAVDRYVSMGQIKEAPLRYQIEFEDLYYSTANRYVTLERAPSPLDKDTFDRRTRSNRMTPPSYVDPLGPTLAGAYTEVESMRAAIPKLHQQYVALPKRLATGELVIRVRAAGTPDRNGRFPRMRVEAGITLGDGCSIDKRALGETDVSAAVDSPRVYEFRIRLEDVPSKGALKQEDSFDRLSVFDMDQIFLSNVSCDPHAIFGLGRGAYAEMDKGSKSIAGHLAEMSSQRVGFLHLDSMEIEMWPGGGAADPEYRWRLSAEAIARGKTEGSEITREFLTRFMPQAFRRPVSDREIQTKLNLFAALQEQGESFETSFKETLAAVLVSPSFLFLHSDGHSLPKKNPISSAVVKPFSDYRLASRLSYLLWLSPPDESLLRHARAKRLNRPDVLRRESIRMMHDVRARRFLDQFCRGWLRLDRHSDVIVDRAAFPDYDTDLADLAVQETRELFAYVFTNRRSALELLDSDYAILNDRLAAHYGIDGVQSGEWQRIELPPSSVRGGLLTHSSVATINSDGIDSHPIRRGAWLLDRILNTPPPPPPPNVPELDPNDPETRGLSLKERIELHRQPGTCLNCHQKIDPWGLAMENLDATGRWRDAIAGEDASGEEIKPIDASVKLDNGHHLQGIRELKGYLRNQRAEQFAAALVYHLVTFSSGQKPNHSDRETLHQIEKQFIESDYRIDELMLSYIQSPLFRRP